MPDIAEQIALLRAWVEIETPSLEPGRVQAFARIVADAFAPLGTRAEFSDFALDLHLTGLEPALRPLLLIGHLDTVYDTGTLATMPFRVDGDRACGPGIYDMKGGIVQALFALRSLAAQGIRPRRSLVLRWVFDEEIGSRGSRAATEAHARASEAALVLEPGQDLDGKLKIARKGIALYTLRAHGVAAHAGVDFEKGASAIVELASQIALIATWSDPGQGITINPGVFHGGTRSNVVAAEAAVELDLRAWSQSDLLALDQRLHELHPSNHRIILELNGGINRPPLESTPASLALASRAQVLARECGLSLDTARTGGGSDGNFTAAVGCPTLDGLGMAGAGAHAPHEHIRLDQFSPRTALLASLLAEL